MDNLRTLFLRIALILLHPARIANTRAMNIATIGQAVFISVSQVQIPPICESTLAWGKYDPRSCARCGGVRIGHIGLPGARLWGYLSA
ncbi:hypothetical protein [uncultured Sulfitobacter sp.]|uniref:hypothetical protein n=1 Tax=uncultured Sulfitobacter sp. TaxID=191468 RepID=UPI00261E78AE|nr:hypothetical protein [uncultured Sulfitobacter sp.]